MVALKLHCFRAIAHAHGFASLKTALSAALNWPKLVTFFKASLKISRQAKLTVFASMALGRQNLVIALM